MIQNKFKINKMKFYYLIIMFSLITIIKTIDYCDGSTVATGPKDCTNLIGAHEFNSCCYFEGKYMGVEKHSCIDLTPVRKKDVDSYIKILNEDTSIDCDIKKIVCGSSDVKINFLFFLLLFMF